MVECKDPTFTNVVTDHFITINRKNKVPTTFKGQTTDGKTVSPLDSDHPGIDGVLESNSAGLPIASGVGGFIDFPGACDLSSKSFFPSLTVEGGEIMQAKIPLQKDDVVEQTTRFKLFIFCKCGVPDREGGEAKTELIAVITWGFNAKFTIGEKPEDTTAKVTVPTGLPKIACPVSDDDAKILKKAQGHTFQGAIGK